MKVIRVGLAILTGSVCVSSLYAQKEAQAVIQAPRVVAWVERQAVRGVGASVRPPYKPEPVTSEMLHGEIMFHAELAPAVSNYSRPQAAIRPVRKNPLYVSPFRDFLREEWELPANPQKEPISSASIPRGYSGRSLESLRMECRSLGIPAQQCETLSREELANFLLHYKSRLESTQAASLLDKGARTSPKKHTELDVKTWAQAQPDFIVSNYLDHGEEYTEPFTGPVTPLRILVVNDEWEEVELFRAAAWKDGNVRIDYAESVQKAMYKLENRLDGYDIVLLDHDMYGGNGSILSMWMHEKNISIPAILFSREYIAPEWLYKFNIKGRIYVDEDPQAVLNFARNIVTTGKAYPAK
ncbi:MAG: hypothetical protein IKP06_05120 [Elusimicrobiaceae bacterium]|nr:hypothetical protein [Elusimicrobiaceae bacterium]